MKKTVTIITAALSLVIFLAGPVTAGMSLKVEKSASGEWMVGAMTDAGWGYDMRITEDETSGEYDSNRKGKVKELTVYKVNYPGTTVPQGNTCEYTPDNPSESDQWEILIQEGFAVFVRNKVAIHTCYPATDL